MKHTKKIVGALVAACLCLTPVIGGCSTSTNNRKDMEQVIAEVDISSVADKDEVVEKYGEAIGKSSIIKRDLVAYFLNAGSSLYNSGSSYSQIITTLVDELVNTEVLTQYSTMYLLNEKGLTAEQFNNPVVSAEDKDDPQIVEAKKYEQILDADQINIAKYTLYTTINNAIDGYEQREIEEEKTSGEGTRTTPGNVDTEVEDYYPKTSEGALDYGVYTGYDGYLLDKSGIYQEDVLKGSTRTTRRRAYNSFLTNLKRNYLLGEKEDSDDVLNLDYVQEEYVSQLKSRVIATYYDKYEELVEQSLTPQYLTETFNNTFDSQSISNNTAESFATAMDGMSDTDLILYAPEPEIAENRYGFVYNILLPFDSVQNRDLALLQSEAGYDSQTRTFETPEKQDEYYYKRNQLIKSVKGEDQRGVWINGETEYYFDASEEELGFYNGEDSARKYLFFENNLTDSSRYESLSKYDGRYAFNGKVNENGVPIAAKLDIDGLLTEFSAYLEYVLDGAATVEYSADGSFYTNEEFRKKDASDNLTDKFDYSKFIYAEGKVDFGTATQQDTRENVLKKDSAQYKALSAVNELQFAYTTDTAILSTYLGYSVSTADTNFIPEFEYAAQKAVRGGAGTFNVCAGDYGWHLIYCTYAFDVSDGAQVSHSTDWSNIKNEGTFENLFYEWVKDTDLVDLSTTRRSKLISVYKKDATVKKYQDRYQDLLDL